MLFDFLIALKNGNKVRMHDYIEKNKWKMICHFSKLMWLSEVELFWQVNVAKYQTVN